MEGRKDEELIALSREGDKLAMDTLLHRYKDLVRSCARQYFLIGGETEDLIQEGMIGLYNAINDFDGDLEGSSSFKSFARLCVTRKILDVVKSVYRKKNGVAQSLQLLDTQIEERGLSPEDLLIMSDEWTELRQMMGKELSPFEFKAMTMYVDGAPYKEICNATGKSSKSVNNAIQRSKKKLLEILKK